MTIFKKEIEAIKALNLSEDVKMRLLRPMEQDIIFSECGLCPVINDMLHKKEITIEEAYMILKALVLIDEECLEDEFIDESFLSDYDD